MSVLSDIRELLSPGNLRLSSTLQPEFSVTKGLAAAGDYAAEDVLSESATVGTAWHFRTVLPRNGARGYITGAHIIWATTALTPAIRLYLFNENPSSELSDNVANTAVLPADLHISQKYIDFPALADLGGGSEALISPSTTGGLPLSVSCAAKSRDMYGIAVLKDAVTGEAAGAEMRITLTFEEA